jgi:hypothetical protein
MAEQAQAEAQRDIDILIAVNIPDLGSFGAICDDGVNEILPQRIESRHGTRIGQHTPVFLGVPLGATSPGIVVLDQLLEMSLLSCRK